MSTHQMHWRKTDASNYSRYNTRVIISIITIKALIITDVFLYYEIFEVTDNIICNIVPHNIIDYKHMTV